VFVFGNAFHNHYKVPIINPVSNIGAGDNFKAGIIKALLDFQILKKDDQLKLSAQDCVQIAAYAIEFSSEVCMRIDNYVDVQFKSNFASKVERRIASSSN
jgi:fructokinase